MSAKLVKSPGAQFPFSADVPAPRDAFVRGWVAEALLRMRRELCWLWRNGPTADMLVEWLQGDATTGTRAAFFAKDPAALYLDGLIRKTRAPLRARKPVRGSFGWVAEELRLSRLEIFAMAVAMAAARDASIGPMLAALQGGSHAEVLTPGLLQRLWQDGDDLVLLASATTHPLFAYGLLEREDGGFAMRGSVARLLETPASIASMPELELVCEGAEARSPGDESDVTLLALRMMRAPEAMRVAPLRVSTGRPDVTRAAPALRRIAAITGRPVFTLRRSVAAGEQTLRIAGTACWLAGADLLLTPDTVAVSQAVWANALRPLPMYVFAAATEDESAMAGALPVLQLASPDVAERMALWIAACRRTGLQAEHEFLREVAYRFRLDGAAIDEIAEALRCGGERVTQGQMVAACQQQIGAMIGPGATLVRPRFRRADLVLDGERAAQLDELLGAMRAVARVHADWGTGAAWGDAGVSALFAGPPGTGKTMAAEVIAAELNIPLYRVDLSQVVNKYIGETEKNLRRLFDAAEQAEVVLFFDEADALFGKRMDVRSSNDRFANMEVGYLLERMDCFRGLAILATNRRKDLDEAFLRRLRFSIEFPLPAEAERRSLWAGSIPAQVSIDALDLEMLAREFALSGGNIRSVVLNACLQAAAAGTERALTQDVVLRAVAREYETMGRPLTREQKARWRMHLPGLAGPRLEVA